MASPAPHITGLHRYPVKSLRGHALDRATIEPRGIVGDRRWMVVDDTGRFQTRRELPHMARFEVDRDGDALILSHPDLGVHRVGRPDGDAATIEARIWRDTVSVRLASADAAAFLSRALGKPVRLVYQDDMAPRPIDPRYASVDDQVSLADGFPFLITSEASLRALNAHLAVPVGMERFRPNIVIAGADEWAEDRWRRLRIGNVTLRIVKPCARCVITTQHPLTGEQGEGNDPLTTLRAMGRMAKGGVMFGQNAIPDRPGEITVGDQVEVLEEGESNLR
ncbi:MAG: MOSC N-terminal beta barrel domain-containing protein [Pseudomonadota bacterium]|uniref:MOSC domain-containing protein n=1 Tax=Sphingomonas sp. ERG5 TaxID=1381597 RepID=UPI00054BD508|nr:MOSC N-terminal beta barrel domain-containing protein [Sphingomonas sp. ERG5]